MKTKFALLVLAFFATSVNAQENFKSSIGNITVKAVGNESPILVPSITWGGDLALYYSNGNNSKTQNGSFNDQVGLDITIEKEDDFSKQVKNYMEGKTPFLRGTFRMIAMASEVLGSNPKTKPVVVVQLSYSKGDHIVAKDGIKNLNDLKGKKIACQKGGPHIGLLYDALKAASLTKDDVEIYWVDEITGENGPGQALIDNEASAACLITPDMIGLTGGFGEVGSGAEGTIEGAKTIVSTNEMSRSVVDVWCVRKDWYTQNKPWVEKFVSSYLYGTKQILDMRNDYEKNQRLDTEYEKVLKLSQTIFGSNFIVTPEIDGHGLLIDCGFSGLPGQISFFQESENINGFDSKLESSLNMAQEWGYVDSKFGFEKADFNYKNIASIAKIEYQEPEKNRNSFDAESLDIFPDQNLDDDTIVSFVINFEPNELDFSTVKYASEFQKALESAAVFGNSALVIRGHSDPTKTLVQFLKSAIAKKLITTSGSGANRKYFYNGRPLDINTTETIVKLVDSGQFDGGQYRPRETMAAAMNLSVKRAAAVKKSLEKFAKEKNVQIDLSQIVPVGAGISDPLIPAPRSSQEAKENMRVEFRIIKVNPEIMNESEFDY